MSEPQIVGPDEVDAETARTVLMPGAFDPSEWHPAFCRSLAHTVATEPNRIRAAVAHALRQAAEESDFDYDYDWVIVRWLRERADAIENGADL